mgnify:CR=1 FL=1
MTARAAARRGLGPRRIARGLWRRLLGRRPQPSAPEVAAANTRESYELMYERPDLLEAYLEPGRLAFFEIVAGIAVELAPASAIDVGCGSGDLLAALDRRLGPGCALAGFDHASSGVARARTLVPRAALRVAEIASYPAEPQHDLVLCTEVLEHLDRPHEALGLLQALRRPGGTILITVPDGAIDDFEGHVNFWSEDDLAALLAPYGEVEIRRIQQVTLLALVR